MEAVQLLLDKRADVTLKNTYDQAPMDLAIDNLHGDTVITMLRHKRYRNLHGYLFKRVDSALLINLLLKWMNRRKHSQRENVFGQVQEKMMRIFKLCFFFVIFYL